MSRIFPVQKDVLCPVHGKKIIKLNLNKICEDNDRLYCENCQIRNNDVVHNYEDVIKKLKQPHQFPFFCGSSFTDEIKLVKEQIFQQIEIIALEIQKCFNFIKSYPLDGDQLQKLLKPGFDLDFQDLLDITKKLSQQLSDKKNKIQYKKVNNYPLTQLDIIQKSIQVLKDCTIRVSEIMNLEDPTSDLLNYINPIVELNQPDVIQKVRYDLLVQEKLPFNVSQIQFELNSFHQYVSVAENKEIEGRYRIHIYNLDWKKKQFICNQTLAVHKYKVLILYMHCFLFSIDEGLEIITWNRCFQSRRWLKNKQFDASTLMRSINCMKCNHITNQLILGGDILFAWDVDCYNNSQQLSTLQCSEDVITCLDINLKGELLVSGSKKGTILVFSYSKNGWYEIYNVTLSQNMVRYVKFLSKTNFISIQKNNLYTKLEYNKELQEYEHKIEEVKDLDKALIFEKTFVKPSMNATDGQIKEIEFEKHAQDYFGEHLVLVRNNTLQFFGARKIL